ncbi:putative glucoamylase/glucan 1,4-alpha-glucosidase [Aspergillus melleus]|uniref:putative glucoamylase/glucan 1,4-alpha-glucosidase n=1 Tax=Aspergillus melleus TaxID=138277 RepID=UPI001E8E3EC4|nr:glycoside hydrolase 15 protein [Aspergillus melleus]KAH8428332.1 glycoside hydrolase 15 protein [Aspergillus melleus]
MATMLIFSLCLYLLLVPEQANASSFPAQVPLADATEPLDSWLARQTPYALDGVLNNLGADGAKSIGANPGSVVASPSKANPDYFFTWTRDAALTVRCLVDIAIATDDATVHTAVQQYVSFQAQLQSISNPSGRLDTGGLGEPKFHVDGSAFTGDWGRPQRDGPALRAVTLITYANWLIDHNHSSVAETIWPIIRNDLSYVSEYWNSTTFDLWEETLGSSFFTTSVQYSSLTLGSTLATRLNTSCPNCLSQAPQTLCFLQSFWSPDNSHIFANHHAPFRSGKDVNTILAAIHTFDPLAPDCSDLTFQPCSSRALANHKVVADSFRRLYPINRGVPVNQPIAFGRYPEDVYMGGQPWYLTTLAAAEHLYRAVEQWKRFGEVTVTDLSLGFFGDVYDRSVEVGVYQRGEDGDGDVYEGILRAVMHYADGYLRIVQNYTPPNGALSEQFSRHDGLPISARDLTWSYAALLTAARARQSASSTSPALSPVPSPNPTPSLPPTCLPSSAKGPYINPPVNKTIPFPIPPSCKTPSPISIRFNILSSTRLGEYIYLAGSLPALGSWAVDKALKMRADEYSVDMPLWYVIVDEGLRGAMEYEYKFFRRGEEGAGDVVWEEGGNRRGVVRDGRGGLEGCAVGRVNDVWRGYNFEG